MKHLKTFESFEDDDFDPKDIYDRETFEDDDDYYQEPAYDDLEDGDMPQKRSTTTTGWDDEED